MTCKITDLFRAGDTMQSFTVQQGKLEGDKLGGFGKSCVILQTKPSRLPYYCYHPGCTKHFLTESVGV